MKNFLFMLIVLIFGMSSVYADCRVWMNDDGSINATTDNGELWQWAKLPDIYKDFCIKDTCGSRPSNKWLVLIKEEKAFCSLHICDNLSDMSSDEKTICNNADIQIIKKSHTARLNQEKLEAERIEQKKRIEDEKKLEQMKAEDKIIITLILIISAFFVYLFKFYKDPTEEKEISSTPSYKEDKTESIGTIAGKLHKDSTEEKELPSTSSDKQHKTGYYSTEEISTPFEKTLPYIKKGFLGAIVLIIIASFGNKGEGQILGMIVGLMGALFIISFFIWLFFSIKDNSTTKNIKQTVKKATTDFMNDKPKPKDANDTADAILKYHSMLEKGIISQQEFDQIKIDLLGNKS